VNQVAKDEELLDVAKDYFQFVTRFFEVINVSAPHIYHSALELCPTSSIIRKLYYHQRIACLPKVVIGAPDSWDVTTGIYSKDHYNGLCTWSPCGRFVAAHTGKATEIRDQLTLELTTLLQPTETIPRLTGPLAYSPDGHSIACASNTATIIWDIQTGGVAKEVKCSTEGTSLVWSSDGQMLCTIRLKDPVTFTVHTYDISSGATLCPGTLQSRDNPHLWTHDKSFRIMTTAWGRRHHNDTIDIFEVGSTLTKIQSFVFPFKTYSIFTVQSFSPITHCISISNGLIFYIWDIQNSKRLLCDEAEPYSHSFSPDGSLLAASHADDVCVWTYASTDGFTLSREFRCWRVFDSLRFSPTLSSIVGHSGDILQVWYLREPATVPRDRDRPFTVGLSRSGTRVAIAYDEENTITITDPLAQTPPQIIDVGAKIWGLVITGNVLLVQSIEGVVAWLLTEEGLVVGVVGGRRVDRGDSIWTVSHGPHTIYFFRVQDHVGVIDSDSGFTHIYRTETGEVLHPTQTPRNSDDSWISFTDAHRGRNYLRYHNLSQCDISPRDSWQFSRATLREGWIKDPEGKHRLWVPVEWRDHLDPADWLHDLTIQFSRIGGKLVLVKF